VTLVQKALLTADAKNRSLRTFLVGLSIDVGVGVTLVFINAFATANDWSDIDWLILSFSLGKSIVQAAGSFILRRFVDASKIPTPLPPDPPGKPADEVAPPNAPAKATKKAPSKAAKRSPAKPKTKDS